MTEPVAAGNVANAPSPELYVMRMKNRLILLVFTLSFLLGHSVSHAKVTVHPPHEILHREADRIVEIYGKPSRTIELKDGLSYLCEWHLKGRNVIIIEFDPFGICTDYGISGYIPEEIKNDMLGSISIAGRSYSFEKKKSWNPFASEETYVNSYGYTALVKDSYIEVSIDRNVNKLYRAQVEYKRN
jgi:hypothetical protein